MPDHLKPEDRRPQEPQKENPLEPVGRPQARGQNWGSNVIWTLVLLVIVAGVIWIARQRQQAKTASGTRVGGGRPGAGSFPVPVIPGVVQQKDVPIYLDGLGTVQAYNSVTVRSRVDGQVVKVAFVEGQDVHVGDILAQIDPAPFQAQLDQNIAKKAQDEAQLAIARLTLTRNKELLVSKILSQQEYDAQQAVVDELVATVQGDQAAIDNARVQLGYATISSPLDGRTGLRLVDQGNIVHANDSTGLVVIAQLRPISLTFTLPEQSLQQIQQHMTQSGGMIALALDRDNRATLSQGKLAVVDNQIDTTTGTIRLKATFANDDLKLWPGQFVNVRLLLETRPGPVVPASVVQRGPDGDFAFVISSDLTAQVRKIKVAQVDRGQALIAEGLSPGERVVVDGQYKLQPGSKVKLPDSKETGEPPPGHSNATARAAGTS